MWRGGVYPPPRNVVSSRRVTEKLNVPNTLLNRIATGEREAVPQVIDRYGGLVWSLARRLTPKGEDPEDAVQEIFIEIWKNADRFDPDKGEEAVFVAMIARRRLIDRLRKTERKPDVNSIDDVGEIGADQHNPETSADAALAVRVMAEMKPEQRRMLTMSLQLGLSHGEIAEVTQTAVGTVKSHIRRGLITLRDRLMSGNHGKRRKA